MTRTLKKREPHARELYRRAAADGATLSGSRNQPQAVFAMPVQRSGFIGMNDPVPIFGADMVVSLEVKSQR